MIHEKQVRQLCAIHCVNNLLQLSKDSDCESEGVICLSDGSSQQHIMVHEWRCHGRLLYRGSDSPTKNSDQKNANSSSEKMNWGVVATQSELDDIAEEITYRELRLMEGNDPMTTTLSNDCNFEKQSVSTLSRFRSKHGTPIFGNYSYEVLETALCRRGVTLEYYRVDADTSKGTSDTPIHQHHSIGFIVHEEETSSADSLSYLRRLGSRIPIIRNICKGGRHWWAVTGVKRSCCLSDAPENENTLNEQKEDGEKWFIIDSRLNHIPTLSSEADLLASLRDVQSRGALIFRCFITQH